jgi:CrcB protein
MDFDGEHTRLPIDPDLAPDDPAEPSRTHTVTPKAARHGRARPDVLLAIALGGSLGTLARYGVAQVIHVAKGSFPWATFWTNVSGSFVLGFALILVIERFPPTRYVRAFVAVGFLGAYTTFSTFSVETVLLVKDGHAGIAVAYVLGSVATGLLAVWVGIVLGRSVPTGVRAPR